MRRQIELPLSCAEIQRKVAAWRELMGQDPIMTVSGHLIAESGETVRPNNSEVTHVGRKWLTVRLNGALVKLDPTSCDPRYLCYLYLEEAR